MPNPPLDPAIHAQILELHAKGWTRDKIAQALNLGHGTVSKWNKIPLGLKPHGEIISNKKEGKFDWRQWAGRLEDWKAQKKETSWTQDHAYVQLGDGDHDVALASFSDQHIGSWGTNYKLLTEMTDELMSTENLFVALLGDYGQYSIRMRSVLEVSDNIVPPETQSDFLESWFEEIWSRVAFATWDNHGVMRQEDLAGESSVKRLLSRKVVYFNGIGHGDVQVGDQLYLGAMSHFFRGRSLLNPVHGAMRYMRFEGTDREWAMAGDSHEPGMIKYADGEKVRVAVNAGSLQTNSGYAKRFYSLTTHPVYPILVFHHDRHEITPFWSVKEWLEARR